MFSTIFVILLVLLITYYAVMIAMDLGKAKAEEKSNADNEIEIDISEEISEFKPVEISRKQATEIRSESTTDNRNSPDIEQQEEQYYMATHGHHMDIEAMMETLGNIPAELRNGENSGLCKEPVLTDGLEVEDLLSCVEELATKGKSSLGDIIYECQTAA